MALRIGGGTRFLVVNRTEALDSHTVRIYNSFDDVVRDWASGTRVSPIFSTVGSREPDLSGRKQNRFVFIGPVFPGDLPPALPAPFLTLGSYNVLFVASSTREYEEIAEYIERTELPSETWLTIGKTIKSVEFRRLPETLPRQQKLEFFPSGAEATSREYAAMMAGARAKASRIGGQPMKSLEEFDLTFRSLFKSAITDVSKQGLLVVANAALSRHTSQMYSGTSPILETECHFWTHSLLGIGIPCLALQTMYEFVRAALETAQLDTRIAALAEVPAAKTALTALVASDPFWDNQCAEASKSAPEPMARQLTFFSGRDGFASTPITVSAPLEIISSCNTVAWTPMTVTHELSHSVIDGILALVLPAQDSKALAEAARIVNNPTSATNLLEQVRGMVCNSICDLHSRSQPDTDVSGPELEAFIRQSALEVNEILTHVFDYLYFYQGDPDEYVRSLWISWGAIPNIRNRIPEYVIRTACALHALNLSRTNGAEETVNILVKCLESAARFAVHTTYVEAALLELQNRRMAYVDAVKRRTKFIRFVRTFLYQPDVAANLKAEVLATAGTESGGYTLLDRELTPERIQNPLYFAKTYAVGTSPDAIKSVWMLLHLAFVRPR